MAGKASLLVFMLIVLFAAGIIGFSNAERMSIQDSFYTTVSTITFSSDNSGFSGQGKLLGSFLKIASVVVIVWAFATFHHKGGHKIDISEEIEDYFRFMPPNEKLAMKDVMIAKGSDLAGKRKIDVLRKTGTVVFAVKKGSAYDVNVPFSSKIPTKAKLLVMGNLKQIKEFERQAGK